ncbi:condensin complex subunit 2/barren [Irpex lacteus]|nr:condensin complex subunit 2/barren [Irpex lacteus]
MSPSLTTSTCLYSGTTPTTLDSPASPTGWLRAYDNSINFQRASFTLDGYVKIWTSRVDSVGTETGKLLSNLANEGRAGEDDGDNDEEGGEEGGSQQNKKKKKTHRPASTLARDAAQLRSKKLHLGFRVDPMFRKTCADFDEGGAQGLLTDHLSLGVVSDGSLRVVFDASDSIAKDGEEEDSLAEPPDEVNLSEIRKNHLPILENLEDKAICHFLDGFPFSKDAFAMDDLTMFRDDAASVNAWDDDENEPAGINDDAEHDDYVDQLDSPSAGSEHAEGREESGIGGGGEPVPFDPRRPGPNENDLTGRGLSAEHWKLRKVVRRPVDTADAPTKQRQKKEAFKIDFLTPSDKSIKDIAKELFALVTKGAGITLLNSNTTLRRGKGRREEKSDNTLPDDMHFSSRQLMTLLLKPKFSRKALKMRGRLEDRADGEIDEIDENFWTQAAADQAAGRAEEEDIDQTQGGGAIAFNTEFFQDDYDDTGGFDDGGDMGGDAEAEQELLSSAQGPTRRVRPKFVNYAKRAKRVNVRKLKENIWRGLDIIVPEEGEELWYVEADDRFGQPTDPAEPRVFENVIGGMKKSYSRDKMEEISTSFCFICLLHLANERGLKLESSADAVESTEEEEGKKKIGNTWDLKRPRDPDATPAA